MITILSSISCIAMYYCPYLLEQLNPSPTVYGSIHVHVKFGLSNPSLSQSALTSHGPIRQGSGTNRYAECV